MIINHNMSAINAQRQMYKTATAQSKSTEKLSSGLRINRAGDDAAGLAISEKMRGQISGLNQASRNAQDGISLIQTAEGALDEQHSMLQRMRELAVQAENDTNTDSDRAEIQNEIDQLVEEISAITEKTEFNTKKLLNGDQKLTSDKSSAKLVSMNVKLGSYEKKLGTVASLEKGGAGEKSIASVQKEADAMKAKADELKASAKKILNKDAKDGKAIGGLTFQVGANAGQTITVGIGSMTADDLGVESIDVSKKTTNQGVNSNVSKIDAAINMVSSERSKLGAVQNRLEHTIANVDNSAENLQASESRVRDTDMAKEMMALTSKNVLSQATQAMLAQANQKPNQVLSLLQ